MLPARLPSTLATHLCERRAAWFANVKRELNSNFAPKPTAYYDKLDFTLLHWNLACSAFTWLQARKCVQGWPLVPWCSLFTLCSLFT